MRNIKLQETEGTFTGEFWLQGAAKDRNDILEIF
jgi:hypothetical protein